MIGLDYQTLRSEITIEQVLGLLGFRPSRRKDRTLRGACPIHASSDAADNRCFSVHLQRNLFRCFHCGAAGNQLDLWQLVQKQPLYPATLRLCEQLGIQPPCLLPPDSQCQLNPATRSHPRSAGQPANRYHSR
jgi:DNA primase